MRSVAAAVYQLAIGHLAHHRIVGPDRHSDLLAGVRPSRAVGYDMCDLRAKQYSRHAPAAALGPECVPMILAPQRECMPTWLFFCQVVRPQDPAPGSPAVPFGAISAIHMW